jgi:hypothetical protein
MRLFKKHDIPITFYAVGRAFERNPAVAEYAEKNGHEVASHCYKVSTEPSFILLEKDTDMIPPQWKPYTGMTAEEEEEYIRKAVQAFKTTSPTGKVPVGVSDLRSQL